MVVIVLCFHHQISSFLCSVVNYHQRESFEAVITMCFIQTRKSIFEVWVATPRQKVNFEATNLRVLLISFFTTMVFVERIAHCHRDLHQKEMWMELLIDSDFHHQISYQPVFSSLPMIQTDQCCYLLSSLNFLHRRD